MTQVDSFKLLCELLLPFPSGHDANRYGQLNTLTQEDWIRLVKRASRHLVTPALYCLCRDKGILSQLPEDLQDYLEAMYQLNLERNQLIKTQALEAIAVLNQAGIEPILLKGIASLLTDLYPDPGMRVMGDIDMLIPPERLDDAVAILGSMGYVYVAEYKDNDFDLCHHMCPLTMQDRQTTLELHRRLTSLSPQGMLLNNRNHWQSAHVLMIENTRCFVLCPADRLLHNFYHTQIQDRNFYRYRISLRQLLEWVWLRHHYEKQIDWYEFLEDIHQHHLLTPFTTYLLSAQIYLGQALPAGVVPTLRAHLQIKAEQLFRRYLLLRRSVRIMRYGINGITHFFSQQSIQLRYGDVSSLKGWWLRFGELCTPSWYQVCWNSIKQLFFS